MNKQPLSAIAPGSYEPQTQPRFPAPSQKEFTDTVVCLQREGDPAPLRVRREGAPQTRQHKVESGGGKVSAPI